MPLALPTRPFGGGIGGAGGVMTPGGGGGGWGDLFPRGGGITPGGGWEGDITTTYGAGDVRSRVPRGSFTTGGPVGGGGGMGDLMGQIINMKMQQAQAKAAREQQLFDMEMKRAKMQEEMMRNPPRGGEGGTRRGGGGGGGGGESEYEYEPIFGSPINLMGTTPGAYRLVNAGATGGPGMGQTASGLSPMTAMGYRRVRKGGGGSGGQLSSKGE